MKKLIMINGTMGVGKTTVSQQLKHKLPNSVFLDGDWCWDASPFIVNDETKNMVHNNISTLLQNFLTCSVYDHILFCWVMDEQSIIDDILKELDAEYELFIFTLLCDNPSLVQRLQKDVENGLRKVEVIERSLERNKKYQDMDTIHIDVSNKDLQAIIAEMETKITNFPIFPYYPGAKEEFSLGKGICQCCGEETEIYYDRMYTIEDIDCLCPECIKSGKAAKKFDGSFIQDLETYEGIPKEIIDEVSYRTPGYSSWQGEYWLTHCQDACEYLGNVGIQELEQLGILEEVLKDYESHGGYNVAHVREYLYKTGDMTGYLFRCKHCGKYRIWVDAS